MPEAEKPTKRVRKPLLYRCHKEVRAIKIKALDGTEIPDGSRFAQPTEGDVAAVRLDGKFVAQHDPKVGGYLVFYKDGYMSYSPAEAFESGYDRIDDEEPYVGDGEDSGQSVR